MGGGGGEGRADCRYGKAYKEVLCCDHLDPFACNLSLYHHTNVDVQENVGCGGVGVL